MIFVDTSFWAALQNRADPLHSRSRQLFRHYSSEALLTTNHVRGETWTLLRGRAGHRVAIRFLEMLEASERMQILFVSEALESAALLWLRRHDEVPYSFVDATSFVVMGERKIRDALTFDDDFAAAGFNVLASAPTVDS